MTIRLRLFAGFSILILALVGITSFALIQMGDIKSRLDFIVDVSSQKVYLAEKLKTQILTVTVLEKDVILSESQEEANSLISRVNFAADEVDKKIIELKSLLDRGQSDALSSVDKNWKKYIETAHQVNALATTMSLKQARGISEGEGLIHFDKIMENILALLEKNSQELKRVHKDQLSYENLILERALVMGIENNLFSMQESEQSLLYSKTDETIKKYVAQLENDQNIIQDKFKQLDKELGHSSLLENDKDRYRWLRGSYQLYLARNQEIRKLVSLNPKQKAHEMLSTTGEKYLTLVNGLLDQIIQKNESEMISDQVRTGRAYTNTRNLVISMLASALVVCSLISYFLAHSITRPLNKLNKVTQALAKGDNSVRSDIDTNHEVGDLAKAFNEMASMIDKRVEMQTRLNTLAKDLRGEQDTLHLSERITAGLSRMLSAPFTAIYICHNDMLERYASYAVDQSGLNKFISFGEGSIGQVAQDKKPIHFVASQEDSFSLRSGVANIQAKSISIYPLLHNNELVGVLLLGYMSKPDEEQDLFFRLANENIAIAISAAKSRQTQAKLLRATQQQAGQLNQQQKNLSLINEALEQQKRELEKSKTLLEKKADELDKASRYKSEFLANMSHELRSPLNSLLLLSKTLGKNEEGNLTREQVNSLHYIHSGGQELLSHINDILDLSKIEAGKLDFYFELVSVVDICDELLRTYTPQVKEKNIALYLKIEEGLPTYIRSDKKRVVQVLRNLLSNAIKFTPKGSITLSLHGLDETISLRDKKLASNRSICFSVKDTGIGIAPEKTAAIFEAFQQADGSTSRKYGGTGLGLAISREFSKKLHGEIYVHSTEGEGSTFVLVLPESADEEKIVLPAGSEFNLTREVHRSSDDTASYTEKIKSKLTIVDDQDNIQADDRILLAIEDDIGFSKILIEYAHSKNFKCLVSTNGEEGLALAKKYIPTVITLDIGLPDIDGTSVLNQLKQDKRTEGIPVHIISSYDTSPELKNTALAYLTKPVSNDDLEKLFDYVDNASQELTQMDHRSAVRQLSEDKQGQTKLREVLEGKCALVADDDIRNMFALSQILVANGMQVVKADNGELALNKYRDAIQNGQSIDIVLMDIMMPVMDGYEAIMGIRLVETDKRTPIIALTAKAMAEDREKCLQAGADDYLTKPLDEVKLLNLMKEWLESLVKNV